MPSYTITNEPQIFYYTAYGATNPKQIKGNPKMCINRTNSSCIDYTYPGINKTTHSQTSGFSLLSDINGPYFKKGDPVRFRIINTSKAKGWYKSAFSGPMAWDTAFSAAITDGEMKKLDTGKQTILMDIYSKLDDTVYIFKPIEVEFTP